MNWSLNELEALARKAARGAGYGWGLAEEAGKATRWLSAVGLSGPEALLGLLNSVERARPTILAEYTPTIRNRVCFSQSGILCPLLTGAALCDGALYDGAPEDLSFNGVLAPLMLLPFVAETFGDVSVRWAKLHISVQQGVVSFWGPASDLLCPSSTVIVLTAPYTESGSNLSTQRRATLNKTTYSNLTAYAHRTFAPATEASRQAGAGADLSDND